MAVSKMQNMKFIIKKRITGEIMYEGEAESFIKFVEQNKANLSKANLYEANLYEADLYEAKIKATQKEELLKALMIKILD